MNVAKRYERLLARRAPTVDRIGKRFAEGFESTGGENTKYLLGALKAVDSQYTARLEEQGDRVQNQIQKGLAHECPGLEFARQGSVSNRTHIKHYSDVDVLVVTDKFYTLEPPQQPTHPYRGVPEDELLSLRRNCNAIVRDAFPKVTVDDSGSTAIRMTGGSLVCPVDVVPANWYDTNAYAASKQLKDRGIHVLNRDQRKQNLNYPFQFNHRLDVHDTIGRGLPRSFIRLLKTVKADLEEESKSTLSLSSFDICSIAYRMPSQWTLLPLNNPLTCINELLQWIKALITLPTVAESIMVVDDTRKVFDEGSKLPALHQVFNDLCEAYSGALREQPGGRLLTTGVHWG